MPGQRDRTDPFHRPLPATAMGPKNISISQNSVILKQKWLPLNDKTISTAQNVLYHLVKLFPVEKMNIFHKKLFPLNVKTISTNQNKATL